MEITFKNVVLLLGRVVSLADKGDFTECILETEERWPDGHALNERHEVWVFNKSLREGLEDTQLGDRIEVHGRIRRKASTGEYLPYVHAHDIMVFLDKTSFRESDDGPSVKLRV